MKTVLPLMATVLYATCLLALASCGKTPSVGSATDSASSPEARGTTVRTNASASPSPLCVTIMDVGKGDCILLREGDAAALIDTGYQSTADDVVSRLRAQGVTRIDAMVITHYDRDHVDGIRAIGNSVRVDTVYLPGYEGADKNYRSCVSDVEALGVPTQRVTKETSLRLGSARLTIFPPGVAYKPGTGKVEGNDNDMSLVVTLVNGRDSYLFVGDLEDDGIAAYLAADHGQFDVLKVPHHGQHAKNTSKLLDDVRPKIAVITDAEKDPADKKTLKLLKSANIQTCRTSIDGTIVIESDGSGTYSVS